MKVYIEKTNIEYNNMFESEGWDITDDITEADLVVFTGGADVNPQMYGKFPHPTTHYNDLRDARCDTIYNKATSLGIPMAGICRGSQYLHVKAGGELVQDCNHHAVREGHLAYTAWGENEVVHVSSTHHQMMYSDDVGDVLMWAEHSTCKETMNKGGMVQDMSIGEDIEAMYYPHINAISFQPHPEFEGFDECKEAFFFIVDEYLRRKND